MEDRVGRGDTVKYWNDYNDYVFYSYELEQKLVYWNCSNLKDYLFDAIENLDTWGLSQTSTNNKRAKDIVVQVKEFERMNMPDNAEKEVKKLIPVLKSKK